MIPVFGDLVFPLDGRCGYVEAEAPESACRHWKKK
jgi:hypothetical protein